MMVRSITIMVSVLVCTACTPKGDTQARSQNSKQALAAKVVQGPRLIILGFDGVDPRRVETLIQAGRLPHIKQLGNQGYRGALQTTNPPQSPVAWSAFATGMSAGRHGIFDFIKRDLANHFPQIATTKVRHAEVKGGKVISAHVENLRRGPSFWDVIAQAGVAVRSLSVPYAYPPPPKGARSLAGLGTPDVRGINSSYTLLTTHRAKASGRPPGGGQVVLLEPMGQGTWRGDISGPRVHVEGKNVSTAAPVVVRRMGNPRILRIEVGGTAYEIALGTTSDYIDIKFVPSPELSIQAVTRVTVRHTTPDIEIYIEPLSIDPVAPYLPISSPPELAAQMWKNHGAFKTVGWIHDTSALGNGAMDEAQFIKEAMQTMSQRAQRTLRALEASTDRVLVSVFTATDRIGHMFYRYIDKDHRAPRTGNQSVFAQSLDKAYDAMDRIVGDVVAKMRPKDTLLIMSDHGFDSFRRGFNINSWLVKEGWMVLQSGKKTSRSFFRDVDWSRTKAYALGTGNIYINIQGRDAYGIVERFVAKKTAQSIAAELMKIKEGRRLVVRGAYLGDTLFAGPQRREAPDIRVALVTGYRASWATALGGAPDGIFQANTKKWSGDHASADPRDVPGFLVSNVPINTTSPRIEDLAATAYGYTQVTPPDGMVGSDLLQQRSHP